KFEKMNEEMDVINSDVKSTNNMMLSLINNAKITAESISGSLNLLQDKVTDANCIELVMMAANENKRLIRNLNQSFVNGSVKYRVNNIKFNLSYLFEEVAVLIENIYCTVSNRIKITVNEEFFNNEFYFDYDNLK